MIQPQALTAEHVRELVDGEPGAARDAARVHALVLANERSEVLVSMARARLTELWNQRFMDSAPTFILGFDQETIKGGKNG